MSDSIYERLLALFGEIVFNAGRLDRSIFIDRASYVKAACPTIATIAAGA